MVRRILLDQFNIPSISMATVSFMNNINCKQISEGDERIIIKLAVVTTFEKYMYYKTLSISSDLFVQNKLKQVETTNSLSIFLAHNNSDALDDNDRTLQKYSDILNIDSIKSSNNLSMKACNPRRGSWEQPAFDKKGNLMDQPVTFHTKIKSSGYGQVPNTLYEKMKLKKQQNQQKLLNLQGKEYQSMKASASTTTTNPLPSQKSLLNVINKSIRDKGPIVGSKLSYYPIDCQPPTYNQKHFNFPLKACSIQPVPIFKVQYNSTGSYLAVMTSENTISTLKLSKTKGSSEGIWVSLTISVCFMFYERIIICRVCIYGS